MPYLRAFRRQPLADLLTGMNLPPASNHGAFWWWPENAAVDYWRAKGADLLRVTFTWERMQPTLGAALDATHLAGLLATIDYIIAQGGRPIIGPHNFFGHTTTGDPSDTRYKIGGAGGEVTLAHYVDFWTRLATAIGTGRPTVILDLMNEPEGVPNPGGAYVSGTEYLVHAYNQVIAAIRGVGLGNLIGLEGNGWNNAQFFATESPWYGTANGPAFHAGIVDSANNWIADVHNYAAADHGSGDPSVNATILRTRMENVIAWCISTGRKVLVGEWGVPPDEPESTLEEDNARDYMAYLEANKQHVLGWVWWESRPDAQTTHPYNIPYDTGTDDERLDWMGFPYTPPVEPPAEPDLVLRLTAATGMSVGGTPNWKLTSWADQSGEGNDFTGYTDDERPFPSANAFGTGIAALFFDSVGAGYAERAPIVFTAGHTVFVCFKTTQADTGDLVSVEYGGFADGGRLIVIGGVAKYFTGSNVEVLSGGASLADGNPKTVAVTHALDGSLVLYVDGTSVDTASESYAAETRAVGCVGPLYSANLRQFRAYDGVLDATAIAALHAAAIADVTP